METKLIKLKDGTSVLGDFFDYEDFRKIQQIFRRWLSMNSLLNSLNGRKVNVPDVLSEALFCMAFDAVRTNNTAHSYDCVLRETGEGVQIKSASIENDCTSFGPKSTWDLLYFANFVPNGRIDGQVDFYEIEDDFVYSLILNKEKNETFHMQQMQGRRPRFSIQNRIIKEKDLSPIKKLI